MNNSTNSNLTLEPATLADYPTIQNMARFYVYDRTKYMGWECPEDGMFECIDFKHYLTNPNEFGFLIRVDKELAGFVLIDKHILLEDVDWNMGEFFVLSKFQGTGVAKEVARQIFKLFPGKWSVAVMPENTKAVNFWRSIIAETTNGNYIEVFKTAEELTTEETPDPYDMYILYFET
jgi:predicted acetyltransferase